MKSSADSNAQVDGERTDSSAGDAERTNDDKHSSEVDQNTPDGSQQPGLLSEEKLPEEPLTDHERHLLFEKGIK